MASCVSIHATLAGGDAFVQKWFWFLLCFYPRHPRGWRLPCLPKRTTGQQVSIHATLAGGDHIQTQVKIYILVSIHATLAGGDHFFFRFLL